MAVSPLPLPKSQAAGQQVQVSPFPTIPPVRADMGTIVSCINALTQCMNLLIVNAQSNTQSPNLSGAGIFARASDVQVLATQINTLNNTLKKKGYLP